MSVDGESVPQPDGRVRQGGGGQAGRGRHGRGLQSDASRSASHYLDCLKSKTCHNILSIINSFVSSNQSSLRYHVPLEIPILSISTEVAMQLTETHTTQATQYKSHNSHELRNPSVTTKLTSATYFTGFKRTSTSTHVSRLPCCCLTLITELCFRFQSLNLTHVPDHSMQIYEFR